MPLLLGGRTWGHWTFVRGIDSDGNLLLGNPAPSWKFVGQTMDRAEFNRLGAWTLVWIDLGGTEPEEDPVRIQQLEIELSQVKAQLQDSQNGAADLVTGLAHIADVIVPELARADTSAARRAELAGVARNIREGLAGPSPVPASG
jgi:hypothetical protein